MTYIHQLEDWPKFRWSREDLEGRLGAVRHLQGRLIGRMAALGSAAAARPGLMFDFLSPIISIG
jgi:hypothetical protein